MSERTNEAETIAREACGFIESKTLESDEKEMLHAKLAAACFHLRCAEKERDESAAAVRTLRAADYEALTGGADYGAVKLELENAQSELSAFRGIGETPAVVMAELGRLRAELAAAHAVMDSAAHIGYGSAVTSAVEKQQTMRATAERERDKWEESCRFNSAALMEALRQSDQERLEIIALREKLEVAKTGFVKIRDHPFHSEMVGSCMNMSDIAKEALAQLKLVNDL